MVSTKKIVDTMSVNAKDWGPAVRVNQTGRRTYSLGYKHEVVRKAMEPGVSMAGVALAHGINANLLRRWTVRYGGTQAKVGATSRAQLVPVLTDSDDSDKGSMRDISMRAQQVASARAVMEIEYHGARIRVHDGVRDSALRCVLEVLAKR
jgi:transposase